MSYFILFYLIWIILYSFNAFIYVFIISIFFPFLIYEGILGNQLYVDFVDDNEFDQNAENP